MQATSHKGALPLNPAGRFARTFTWGLGGGGGSIDRLGWNPPTNGNNGQFSPFPPLLGGFMDSPSLPSEKFIGPIKQTKQKQTPSLQTANGLLV